MSSEPNYDDIVVEQRKKDLVDKLNVECKTDAVSENIKKIYNVSGRADILSVGFSAGQVKYGGEIKFYLCFESEEGEILKRECGAEFTGQIPCEESSVLVLSPEVKIEKTEALTTGVNLSVVSHLEVKISVIARDKCKVFTGGDGYNVKTDEVERIKSFGTRESFLPIEEEFEFNYKIKEVLDHRADAVITAVQCGVNSIIVDGEVYLSAILLQNGEKKDIIKENKAIPFRTEIECEEAEPSCFAWSKVCVKSFKSDISVDSEKESSLVKISVGLKIFGEAYFCENTNLVCDVFSLSEDLEVSPFSAEWFKPLEVRSETKRVSLISATDEIPVGAYVSATGGERVEVLSVAYKNDQVVITGVYCCTAFFIDSENKIFTRKIESPFETAVDCRIPLGSDFEVKCLIEKSSGRIVSSTELEIEGDLIFTFYAREKHKCSIIKDVKVKGEKVPCPYAISVYIASPNEELWDLSKRLNICPDDLVASNPELNFPLTGKERIVVYRKK